jgi:GTP cyclohydrolase I
MSQEQKPLVDITSMDSASISSPLQWVGMEGISIPLLFDAGGECPHVLNAKADAFVSIDIPDTKGIHMSRLYTRLAAVSETPLNHESVHKLLRGFVESQKGISQSARVALHFDLLLKKPALLSDEAGYQSNPSIKALCDDIHKAVVHADLNLNIRVGFQQGFYLRPQEGFDRMFGGGDAQLTGRFVAKIVDVF